MFQTYVIFLEDLGVSEGVLGRQDDVLQELRVGERPHLVVPAEVAGAAGAEHAGEAPQGVRVQAARVHPLGLGRAVVSARQDDMELEHKECWEDFFIPCC